MQIADLYIRVTGDTSDVINKLRAAGVSLQDFGQKSDRASASAEGHRLSLGRVERALATYVGHAAGANAVTEALSVAFGSFALGGGVVAGVLLGLGAIIAVYEKLTEGTRKAAEANDKFTKSLVDQADARHKALITGLQDAVTQANSNLTAAKAAPGGGLISMLLQGMAPGGQSMGAISTGDAADKANNIKTAATAAQEAVNQLGEAIGKLNSIPMAKPEGMKFGFNELRDAADKVNAKIAEDTKNFWRGYIEKQNEALTLWQQIGLAENAKLPSLVEAVQSLKMGVGVTPVVDVGAIAREAGPAAQAAGNEQAKKINEAAEQHAQMISNAVWGAAINSANIIVGALNVGGGGKGSQLGGALGSTAGFAIGMMIPGGGPVTGAIGSTVGNVIGSFIGGLFDNSSATRENTNATRQLVSALLQNTPSGFKVESYRYNASDAVKQFQKDYSRYKTRGGPNLNAA